MRARRTSVFVVFAAVALAIGSAGVLRVSHGQPASQSADHAPQDEAWLRAHFDAATKLLAQNRFAAAEAAFTIIVEREPRLAEGWANLGFARLGQGKHRPAVSAFERGVQVRPEQANVYYGLAVAFDALGDRAQALGAMRTFVHLAPPDTEFVRKARAALWEWHDGERTQ